MNIKKEKRNKYNYYQVEFDVALTMVDWVIATSEEEAKEKLEERIDSYRSSQVHIPGNSYDPYGFVDYLGTENLMKSNRLITHAEFAYDDFSETLRVKETLGWGS